MISLVVADDALCGGQGGEGAGAKGAADRGSALLMLAEQVLMPAVPRATP